MRFKPLLILGFALATSFSNINAQRNYDIGIFFGLSHYMGDLQRYQFEILEVNRGEGIYGRYNFSNLLSFKAQLYHGVISGSDSNFKYDKGILDRNLSFRSNVYEASFQWELSVLRLGAKRRHWNKYLQKYLVTSYVFGGVGGFYFNPKAKYGEEWYELQPLGTEGQGMPGHRGKYNRLQVCVPFGFGIKINPVERATIGLEFGFRKTFTDYLDDVSTVYPNLEALSERDPMAAALSWRGQEISNDPATNPAGTNRGSVKYKDMYFFGGVTIGYYLAK
ncbi:MAG: hypothetical protein H6577_22230 [Lewinellaceae bacterium]|nr:hypothetical protein [Saprospiraceae bacterium]MCB9340853.1 hypothetical protein [Lewinellaceae bacterium]